MLPGFAMLFGLGSLFVSACSAKPRPAPYDPQTQQLERFLRKVDAEPINGILRPYSAVPPDYPGADPAARRADRGPGISLMFWEDLARCHHTTIAQERCEYFRWRCQQAGIPFDYGTVIRYCESFGPLHRRIFED